MTTVAPLHKTSSWSLFPTRLPFLLILTYLLMLGFPLLHPLFAAEDPGAYMGFIPANLFLVCINASTAREFLVRPFSYTLPWHRQLLCKHLLTIAWVGNAVFILPMLLYPAPDALGKVSAITAVYAAGVALNLGFTKLTLQMRDANLLSLLLVLSFLAQFQSGNAFYASLAMSLTAHPLLVLVLALLLLKPFAATFNSRSLERSLLDTPFIGFIDSMDMNKFREYYALLRLERGRQKPAKPSTLFFSLGKRLQRSGSGPFFCFRHQCLQLLHKVRYFCNFQQFIQLILVWSGLIIVLFYMGSASAKATMIQYLFCFVALSMPTLAQGHPFLPYARRDLALGEFLLGLVYALYCLLLGIVVIGLIRVLELWLPGSGTGPVAWSLLGFHSLLVPLYFTLRLLIKRLGNSRIMITIIVAIAGSTLLQNILYDDYLEADTATLLLLTVLSWLPYAAATYYEYCRKDLASNAAT